MKKYYIFLLLLSSCAVVTGSSSRKRKQPLAVVPANLGAGDAWNRAVTQTLEERFSELGKYQCQIGEESAVGHMVFLNCGTLAFHAYLHEMIFSGRSSADLLTLGMKFFKDPCLLDAMEKRVKERGFCGTVVARVALIQQIGVGECKLVCKMHADSSANSGTESHEGLCASLSKLLKQFSLKKAPQAEAE